MYQHICTYKPRGVGWYLEATIYLKLQGIYTHYTIGAEELTSEYSTSKKGAKGEADGGLREGDEQALEAYTLYKHLGH